MNCKNIQELLKADHLDGVCAPADERSIRDHLKECPACRELERELRSQQILLKQAKRQDVPEHLWQNIRSAVAAERLGKEQQEHRGSFNSFRDLLFARPPVFALGSGFAVILFILVLTGISVQQKQKSMTFDVSEYSLADNGTNLLDDLGTNIEEYFL